MGLKSQTRSTADIKIQSGKKMNDQKYYVAINLGSSYITGIVANKLEGGRVTSVYTSRKPSGDSIVHGCIHNVVTATEIISLVIDELSQHIPDGQIIKSVYVGIDCRSMQSKLFTAKLPRLDGALVDSEHLQTLRDQAKDAYYPGMEVIRIADPQYILDGKLEANPRGVRCSSLEANYQIIVARQSVIDVIREVFEHRLGVNIKEILPAPLAEAAVTLTREEYILGAVYINIGGGATSVSLYKSRLLKAMHVIPLGGINITRDLMDLGILERVAETLKINSGSMRKNVSRDDLILVPNTEKSIRQIDLNAYIHARLSEIIQTAIHVAEQSNPTTKEPQSLVLSGGVSKTTDLLQLLNHDGKQQVRQGFVRPDCTSDSVGEHIRRDFQTEIGLIAMATEHCLEMISKPLSQMFEDAETPSTSSAEHDEDDYTFGDADGLEELGNEGIAPEAPQGKEKRWRSFFTKVFEKLQGPDDDRD